MLLVQEVCLMDWAKPNRIWYKVLQNAENNSVSTNKFDIVLISNQFDKMSIKCLHGEVSIQKRMRFEI